MKLARAILAFVWLVLAITATAHAMPAATVPCHMEMDAAHGQKHPPVRSDTGIMPCCSQPAVMAEPAGGVPVVRVVVSLRLVPAPAAPLPGLDVPADRRPPKPVLNA